MSGMKQDKKWLLHEVRKLPYELQSGYSKVKVVDIFPLIDQLDEPRKVIIPQFVAEWYENNKDDLELEMFSTVHSIMRSKYDEYTEFEKWFNKNNGKEPIETIVKMKLYGYEVEKEKLYYIPLGILRLGDKPIYLQKTLDGLDVDWSPPEHMYRYKANYHFTEQEIKDYDPRFWSFAMEVVE